jgi:mannose-1-phosphate guanylyltransferase/mannose-6-phosphate isomerase
MDGFLSIEPDRPSSAETMAAGQYYRVRRLVVPPGGDLGAELHRHRTGQFVILSGEARITRGAATFVAAENASVFIPPGTRHRVQNPGRLPLALLEVQFGSRFADDRDKP